MMGKKRQVGEEECEDASDGFEGRETTILQRFHAQMSGLSRKDPSLSALIHTVWTESVY
jgi:hypothetical protein